MTLTEAKTYRKMIEEAAVSLPDDDALLAPELYPHWAPNIEAVADERMYYDEKLYRVVQSHTTQAGWEPDKTPALFTEVSVDEWPEWKQPTGAQDAYRIGDKCSHNGQHWINTIDYNVYEPGVYGWDRVGE